MATHNFFEQTDAGFPWLASAMLAFEACSVIHLRLAKLAIADDDAEYEARLMVNEKVDAMFEAGASLMAGASAATVIGRYRGHLAANANHAGAWSLASASPRTLRSTPALIRRGASAGLKSR